MKAEDLEFSKALHQEATEDQSQFPFHASNFGCSCDSHGGFFSKPSGQALSIYNITFWSRYTSGDVYINGAYSGSFGVGIDKAYYFTPPQSNTNYSVSYQVKNVSSLYYITLHQNQ